MDPLAIEAFVTRVLGVSPELWARAAARTPSGDPTAVLLRLTQTPAEWAPAYEPTMAVTRFQYKQIVAHSGPAAALERKLRWNGYLVLEALGKGGMGTVYKGWDLGHPKYVALKRPLSPDPDTVRRLAREARLFARVDHPHVARFFTREDLGGLPLLVLEYVPGTDLRRLVVQRARENNPIPWPTAAAWGVQLLAALAAVHAVGVLHRDVKPANVMLRERGRGLEAVLLDMGLGRSLDDGEGGESAGPRMTVAGSPMGTLEYLPPEQWSGGAAATYASDVYGLGVTLYEVLAGHPPFSGNMAQLCYKHLKEPPPPLPELRPDVPPGFTALVHRMLEKDPRARGTADGLATELQAVIDWPDRLPPPPPPPDPERRPPPTRVKKTATTTAVVRPQSRTPGLFTVLGTGLRLWAARWRLWTGPRSGDVSAARFKEETRVEVRRLRREFWGGVWARLKVLVFPHRAPLEWAGFALVAIVLWWLARSP